MSLGSVEIYPMSNISYNFKDKNVLVTGGARGIGLAIARGFLTAGAQVAIWDFSKENLGKADLELDAYRSQLHCRQVDVTSIKSCEEAAKDLPFEVDILVNNAGITRDKSFAKMTSEAWQAVIDTNLTGVFNVTKAVTPEFGSGKNKRIINIASVVALYGNFGQTNYVAAKAGVIGVTKTWAREFGAKGVTVNAVAPGFTLTPMVEAMPKEVLQKMEDKVPVKRLASPGDMAKACMFLASEEASYINGATLSVDGGIVC